MTQSDAPDGREQRTPAADSGGAGPGGSRAPTPEPAGARAQPRGRRGAAVVAGLALLVALGSAGAALFLGWRQGALYDTLAAADGAAEQGVERLAARLDALEEQLGATRAELAVAEREREALEARLEQAPERLGALERRVDALGGGSREVLERWLRAEAEYYLELANAELELADDWSGASTALGLADARLRELGDPRLTGVREAIAEERLALEAVERPDVEGLALRLRQLAERADSLPLRGPARAASEPAASPENETGSEPGLGRLRSSVRNVLSSLVRIERREQPVARALSTDEQRLVRRRLAVNLDLARLALLGRERGSFAASLETARALIEREFDTRAAPVAAALGELEALAGAEIAPDKPEIGGSLARLRELRDGAR